MCLDVDVLQSSRRKLRRVIIEHRTMDVAAALPNTLFILELRLNRNILSTSSIGRDKD